MTQLTRWVLAHKRLVVVFWVALTLIGMASAGSATKALKQKFSVPGKEGWVANQAIAARFAGTGGNTAPLLPVVTLPVGSTVRSPSVRAQLLGLEARARRVIPGGRVAGYASTGSSAFVSKDGRTTFLVLYPPLDPAQSFGDNPRAAERASAAIGGTRILGAPVHVTGYDALSVQSGGGSGPGVLVEAMLGGLGALIVLAFVFASFLAIVPILMAIASILTTFLVIWGLTSVTDVSPIVQFLVALIGLGVSIDYSLLVVVRWREERAHGRTGDEAVLRAMETAGRAVVFSGTTVAIGLLALVALPLPFLRSVGYGGMLIPLISVIVALTLLPVVLATIGPKLDWPHVRTDDKASRSWTTWAQIVVRWRWVAAVVAAVVLALLVLAATQLQPGLSNVNAIAKEGTAKTGLEELERSGIGSGALLPYEALAVGNTSIQQVAATMAAVPGIHGAVAPQARSGSARGRPVADAFPIPDGSSSAGRDVLECDADRRAMTRARRRAGRDPGPEPGLHQRCLRQLPADDPADSGDHVHPARPGLPLTAAPAEGGDPERDQRRRRVGRAGSRVAGGSRLGTDLGNTRDRLDNGVDTADGVRVPVRAVDGLRGVHPRAHPRGVRPDGPHGRGRDHRDRAHGPAGHERRDHPVPRVRIAGVGSADRHQSPRDGSGGRHPARRDRDQGAARAGRDLAFRSLELVAAARSREVLRVEPSPRRGRLRRQSSA